MESRKLVPSLYVIFLLLALPVFGTSFVDNFDTPTLDPAWQLYSYAGPRAYGYVSPANHFSLTDNPGYLRYYLDELTHPDGYINGFLTDNIHSCCAMDPGLDIRRTLTGDHWTLEAGANFAFTGSNGRYFTLSLYFGDGQAGTYVLRAYRGAEVSGDWALERLSQTTAVTPLTENIIDNSDIGALATEYFRLERDGGLLTASWSTDALNWNVAFSQDLGSGLAGLQQQVALSGAGWFYPGDSYADWNYVEFTDQSVPEPATFVMLVTGVAGLLLRRKLRAE